MSTTNAQPVQVRSWVLGEPERAHVYDGNGRIAAPLSAPPGPYQARCTCGWQTGQLDDYWAAAGELCTHRRTPCADGP